MSDVPLDPGIRVEAGVDTIVLIVPGWPVVTMTTEHAHDLECKLHLALEDIEPDDGEDEEGEIE